VPASVTKGSTVTRRCRRQLMSDALLFVILTWSAWDHPDHSVIPHFPAYSMTQELVLKYDGTNNSDRYPRVTRSFCRFRPGVGPGVGI
jgi:hypothetical protein